MIFFDDNKIRTNDLDCFDHLQLKAILDFFQDVAGAHADCLKMGFEEMKQKGYYWVLVKTRFTKLKEPKPSSRIRVKTWPHPKGRIDFVRDYEIYDEADDLLVKGSSQWCIIDITTRRIARTDMVIYPKECSSESVYDQKLSGVKPIIENKIFSYQVFSCDLDHNGHMNNSKYGDIVTNSLSLAELKDIKECQFDYLHEAKLDDVIDVYKNYVDDGIIISGAIGNVPCFSAKVVL